MNRTSLVAITAALLLAYSETGIAVADDAFIKTVSALAPDQQVERVVAKLKELNPAFDGKVTHKIEGGAVSTLSFSTVGVTDISPVKALQWLRTLNIAPVALNQKGSLKDLTPLQGMQLTWLWCHNNPINDLSPLKDMPLTVLSFSGTQVSNLSALTGMKLQVLSFNDTVVSELGPLEGMPLTVLWCNNTKVSDLSPVKAMPLREIKCDFVAERDTAVLRGIRTLAKINDMTAAAFWMRVGPAVATATPAANVGGASASRTTTVAPPQLAMPTLTAGRISAKEQIRRFSEEMKKFNPEFNPTTVKHVIYTGKLVALEFTTECVTNISPVCNLTDLRKLVCAGPMNQQRTPTTPGTLSDIAPVKGLKLQEFDCGNNPIEDLSPLRGMRLSICHCDGTRVSDLTPLEGMPLTEFWCNRTKVTDLSPLKGMKLTVFLCKDTGISDLSVLQGMPLFLLSCDRTPVADLGPLRGMKLNKLFCSKTQVSDLSVIKGMPLIYLWCDFVPDRDSKILRSIKTLTQVNDVPIAEFWKRVEAGDVPRK